MSKIASMLSLYTLRQNQKSLISTNHIICKPQSKYLQSKSNDFNFENYLYS